MNLKAVAPGLHPLLLISLALALLGSAAQAQLMVDMQLSKKNYVDHEPIMATIKVKNLAGHDLILSGPGGGGWLNFDLRRGNSGLSRRPDAPNLKPRALKAGGTFVETVNLGRFYPLGLPSNYAVTASVYYPPLKKYFSSQRRLINVTKAKTLWNQTFGLAMGNNRPVEFRKYSLLSFRGRDYSSLYVRVASQDESTVFATYSLGRVLRAFQPNVDVDSSNRLHVLHLGGPQFYAHSIVDTDGSIIRQEYYKETQGSPRPELKNQSGSIIVRGGIKADRNGVASVPKTNTRDSGNRIRNATERPPGLPQR